MSSLYFCKYPENTSYTLSKQALGLWPCGTSLISSMEFPLHFPPSSAGWPQPHRFFSLPLQKLSAARIKNKTNPSKVRSWWRHSGCSPLVCASIQPLFCSQQLHSCAHICSPERQLQATAAWMQPSRGAGQEGVQTPWCCRHLAGL